MHFLIISLFIGIT